MKVYNMISKKSGREVANQFIIENEGKIYFQSYRSLIAVIDGDTVTLGCDWDYSKTTMKYLNQFLRNKVYGLFFRNNLEISAKGIRKAIEKGIIKYDCDME